MGKVRCVANVELDVMQLSGDVIRKVFAFGEIYEVERIEIVDSDYINVVLADESRIDAVNRKVFENLGKVDTLQLYNQEEVIPNEVIEAPEEVEEEEKDESVMIPLEGTILSVEDEEEDDIAI
jgi:hypothetical protein